MIREIVFLTWIAITLAGCIAVASPPPPTIKTPTAIPAPTLNPSPFPTVDLSQYVFPTTFNPAKRYLFYLHGKIIEDQGLPAVSPDFGEYEYTPILNRFREAGFVVIAELRPKDADGYANAKKVKDQIKQLLDTGVPANHITVVGASKGSVIAAVVSYLLDNEQINYVLLGSCYTEMIPEWKQSHMYLHGNVLSIYDSVDNMAGSCRELFSISAGKGIARHDEIVLHAGTGHGILYKPLDEWMLPTIEWAK